MHNFPVNTLIIHLIIWNSFPVQNNRKSFSPHRVSRFQSKHKSNVEIRILINYSTKERSEISCNEMICSEIYRYRLFYSTELYSSWAFSKYGWAHWLTIIKINKNLRCWRASAAQSVTQTKEFWAVAKRLRRFEFYFKDQRKLRVARCKVIKRSDVFNLFHHR